MKIAVKREKPKESDNFCSNFVTLVQPPLGRACRAAALSEIEKAAQLTRERCKILNDHENEKEKGGEVYWLGRGVNGRKYLPLLHIGSRPKLVSSTTGSLTISLSHFAYS